MAAPRNRLVDLAASIWILGAMSWYAYAFIRDFYAANRHAVAQLLEKLGM